MTPPPPPPGAKILLKREKAGVRQVDLGRRDGREQGSFPTRLECCASNEKLFFGAGTKLSVLGKREAPWGERTVRWDCQEDPTGRQELRTQRGRLGESGCAESLGARGWGGGVSFWKEGPHPSRSGFFHRSVVLWSYQEQHFGSGTRLSVLGKAKDPGGSSTVPRTRTLVSLSRPGGRGPSELSRPRGASRDPCASSLWRGWVGAQSPVRGPLLALFRGSTLRPSS